MITFEPIETEIIEDGVTVPYKIVDAAERLSSNGNDMLVLTLELTMDDGRKVLLENENLVFSTKAMYRVREFSLSSGMYADFKRGQIGDITVKGKSGICEVGYDENPGYRPKNFVKKWIPSSEGLRQEEEFKSGKVKIESKTSGNPNYNPDDPKNDIPF